MLNLLASALRTGRMGGFMLGKMLGMFERLTALVAPVLVSRHGIPPTRIVRVVLARYCLRRPAIIHSTCFSGKYDELPIYCTAGGAAVDIDETFTGDVRRDEPSL
ncbi:hypothetical protein OKW43_002151 [Paraburkholderia sp. WC7.3g]